MIKTTELSLTEPTLTNTDYRWNYKTISETHCYRLTDTAIKSTPEGLLLLLLLLPKVEPHSSVLACYPVYVDCLRFSFLSSIIYVLV